MEKYHLDEDALVDALTPKINALLEKNGLPHFLRHGLSDGMVQVGLSLIVSIHLAHLQTPKLCLGIQWVRINVMGSVIKFWSSENAYVNCDFGLILCILHLAFCFIIVLRCSSLAQRALCLHIWGACQSVVTQSVTPLGCSSDKLPSGTGYLRMNG